MAKSNLSWSMEVDKDNTITGAKLIVEILAIKEKITFALTEIFPKFMEYNQCQMRVICNGLKQKLADDLSRTTDVSLTPQEMKEELKAMWKRLVEGTWFKPGTGGVSKLQVAWDVASEVERKVLEKLGLKPKAKETVLDKILDKDEESK